MELLVAGIAVLIGTLVQTAIGFGMAVVAAPILVIVYPSMLPGPLVAMVLVQCVLTTLRHRDEKVQLKPLRYAILGRVPGSAAGAALLLVIDRQILALLIGIFVLLAVVTSLARTSVRPSNVSMFWAGLLSGLLGTSTTVGGLPMALLLQHSQAKQLRANLAVFFIFSGLLSLLMLFSIGLFGQEQLRLSLYLLPWALAGFWLCRLLPLQLLEHHMRAVVLAFCSVAGIAAIASALLPAA